MEFAHSDDTFPVCHIHHPVHLEAYFRVLSHDIDLHALVGAAVNIFSIIGITYGNDIGNIICMTADAPDDFMLQQVFYFGWAEFSDHSFKLLSNLSADARFIYDAGQYK